MGAYYFLWEQWEQWEQRNIDSAFARSHCKNRNGNNGNKLADFVPIKIRMGTNPAKMGTLYIIERAGTYSERSQSSHCSHKKQVRLQMQNAFIAQLLMKPAPAPVTVALDAPAIEPLTDENIEMHDSTLFDVVVEVDFYDGRRIRIPQQSTPSGWTSPF